jgi:hypothetical protein
VPKTEPVPRILGYKEELLMFFKGKNVGGSFFVLKIQKEKQKRERTKK